MSTSERIQSEIERIHYRKADGRYYVELDGVKLGWVCKLGTVWHFYAVRALCHGVEVDAARRGSPSLALASAPTRSEAVAESYRDLAIKYLYRPSV